MSDYRFDVDDQTWTVAEPVALTRAAVYAESRVRDWRWLWLRRKTVTELLAVGRIDPWPKDWR